MSFSSGRSDDGSIRSLLERLNARSFGDGPSSGTPFDDPLAICYFRIDPLQELREARMKIAGHSSASNTLAEEIPEVQDFAFAAKINERAPWNDGQLHSVVLPPDRSSQPDDAAIEPREAPVVVIDTEYETVSPKPIWFGRSRLLVSGVAGTVLAVMLGSGVVTDYGGADAEQASKYASALEASTGEVSDQAPLVAGIGRFTVPAIRLAEVDPDIAGDTDRSGQVSTLSSKVKSTRLTTMAGGEVALPIKLSPAHGTGEVAAIVLRGLPAGYTVVGGVAGDDSWAVSPDALDTARIMVPKDGAGEVHVTAELFDMQAQRVGAPRFVLAVRPAAATRDLAPERARALLARGHDLLKAGDIAGARLLFEAAAESGVAEGAYALGESFDPIQLTARGAFGLTGDAAQARYWYAHASERGIAEARERLAVLDGVN